MPGGYETDDHGLDLIIWPTDVVSAKDVEDLHHQQAQGRISLETVGGVLQAAASLVALLDEDRRWWADWDDWSP